jgi:hypothetical protein
MAIIQNCLIIYLHSKKNIDIDNLCDPQKFNKKPTQQLLKKKR